MPAVWASCWRRVLLEDKSLVSPYKARRRRQFLSHSTRRSRCVVVCVSNFAQTPPIRSPTVFIEDDSANGEDTTVDKDRIKGSAEQIKGSVKEAVGKALGDKKLETEGKTDKAAGKVQNAVGGLKDALRGE